MEQAPRYTTLFDYLRVIRRRWVIVLGFTVGLGAAALAVSLAQKPTYEASAQIAFRDIASESSLIAGTQSSPDVTAATRAAINAELIARPEVTRRVADEVGSGLSEAELAASVDTRVGFQTNLVILTARADTAALAADIANGYARAVRAVGTREAQRLLEQLETSASRELQQVTQNARRGDSVQLGTLRDRLARIRTLQDITEPVEIAVGASPPADPTSPKPALNTVLGLLVGMTLGLLAAFIRDSLDRRLHGTHEVHHELGMPVLGRVSKTALMYPGLASNGGMPMTEADFEAFRTLRTNLAALTTGEGIGSILVTSGRPDEGKTAVSISLASAFAVSGAAVLLVECDLRRPSFERRLAVARAPGLSDYLTGDASPHEILQVIRLSEPSAGAIPPKDGHPSRHPAGRFVCISAGSPTPMPAELLSGERFTTFLGKVTKAYDVVVIDASPLLAVGDPLQLVPLVDCVLVCVRSGMTTRDEARASRAALTHLRERPTGAVVTGLKRGGVDGYAYYYGY